MIVNTYTLNTYAMKFLSNIFSKRSVTTTHSIQLPSLDEQIENYQAQILKKFINERESRISRLANWDIRELNEAVKEFKEELEYCKITEGTSMCKIFEEKIYQLNTAIEMLHQNRLSTAI